MSIKYVHTNIIARDWRKLAEFYIQVFDCKLLLPERDLRGEWIEKMTNIQKVKIRGAHLSLPGYENGPTLEIFQYEPELIGNHEHQINRRGFGHLAFHVDGVEEVLDRLVANGGRKLGDVIHQEFEGIGLLTAVYAQDPEGNFIEIQNWRRKESGY